jgi:hypothetical protein
VKDYGCSDLYRSIYICKSGMDFPTMQDAREKGWGVCAGINLSGVPNILFNREDREMPECDHFPHHPRRDIIYLPPRNTREKENKTGSRYG